MSSSRHPCDRGHLSVGECLADARHAMSCCCVTYDHPCYFWWVPCVSGAGRDSSEPSKLDVAVIRYTQIPFTAHKAVYTHRCIYTQAHTCVDINTCLFPSGSECYNVRKKDSVWKLFAAFLLPNQGFETESSASASKTSMYVETFALCHGGVR